MKRGQNPNIGVEAAVSKHWGEKRTKPKHWGFLDYYPKNKSRGRESGGDSGKVRVEAGAFDVSRALKTGVLPLVTQPPLSPDEEISALLPAEPPAEDNFNWRKYGLKQVKRCEYPRSYYVQATRLLRPEENREISRWKNHRD